MASLAPMAVYDTTFDCGVGDVGLVSCSWLHAASVVANNANKLNSFKLRRRIAECISVEWEFPFRRSRGTIRLNRPAASGSL
jgi:hypothetical protein